MRRKVRIIRLIVTEILIMSLGVLCCIMPMPWRLIVPIIIGTRSILIKARLQLKQPLPVEEITVKMKDEKKRGDKINAEKKGRQAARKTEKAGPKAAEKVGNKKTARKGGNYEESKRNVSKKDL